MSSHRIPAHGEGRDSCSSKPYRSPGSPLGGSSCSFDALMLGGVIQRPYLQRTLLDSLDHDRVLYFCTEPGSGAHTLCKLMAAFIEKSGEDVSWVRAGVKSESFVCRKIAQSITELMAVSSQAPGASKGLLVIDGLSLKSESCICRLGRQLSGAVIAGIRVVVLSSPEFAYLAEFIPACRIVDSCDLLLSLSEVKNWLGRKRGTSAAHILSVTHGIPSLVGVARESGTNVGSGSDAPAWSDCVISLYGKALRPSLIKEELALRFCMAALGDGSFDDLRSLGIRVSSDLLSDVSRSCPLLGIDMAKRTFSCVAVDEARLFSVLGRVGVEGSPCDFTNDQPSCIGALSFGPFLLTLVVKKLVESGNYRRAGYAADSLEASPMVADIILSHPLEFIDSGHLHLVVRAASSDGSDGTAKAREVLGLLGVAGFPKAAGGRVHLKREENPSESVSDLDAQLLLLSICKTLEGPVPLCEAEEDLRAVSQVFNGGESLLTLKLFEHARAQLLWLGGSSLEAFRELMVTNGLREQGMESPSLFSALLEYDFEALRRLVGDPESPREVASFTSATNVLESFGTTSLYERAKALCELAGIAAGECREIENANRIMNRWRDSGADRLSMWANVLLSLGDSLGGQCQRAYVRAREGAKLGQRCKDPDATAIARMATVVALRGLGEPVEHVEPPSAIAPDIEALCRLHELLGSGAPSMVENAISRMRCVAPRVGVVALTALLVKADKMCGPLLSSSIPLAWKGRPAVTRGLADERTERSDGKSTSSSSAVRIEVSVLGGISVRVDGECLDERSWHRRQAKLLLAMLALSPRHSLQRREAIEELWPDLDMTRGRENLYTVLSSLRSTLGQTSESSKYIRGELGQIWLDKELVKCDVDEFEAIARRIMSRKVADDEVVSLCVALEGMYKGGSFVPASDLRGVFRRRHDELAHRFREAMLMGSEAAARLRDNRQAAWFAQTAKQIA